MSGGNGGGQGRRREPRYYLDEPAAFKFGGRAFPCRIVDISPDGAGLRFDPMPSNTPRVGVLVSERFGQLRCIIKYSGLDRIGVAFIFLSDAARGDLRQKLGAIEMH